MVFQIERKEKQDKIWKQWRFFITCIEKVVALIHDKNNIQTAPI